ncbi:uncharacterized protein JCM6883_002078 [Sporobolomyces salmoneus]|uniref:uncharacterized protein n=1 Tax=Sporobolomyces salmoneus TaxID=183962 RepID=UPI00317E0DAF
MAPSHLPRFPIGAAPADIAPPISLRRHPLLKSKQPSRSVLRPNTQGGTEVGSSRSVMQQTQSTRTTQARGKEPAKEKDVEVIVLEDGETTQSRRQDKGKERERSAAVIDKGKGKEKERPREESAASASKSVPKMPIALAAQSSSSNKHIGPSKQTDRKKTIVTLARSPRDRDRNDKSRSSNHWNGPRYVDSRYRWREIPRGHWRGGNARHTGHGRAASPTQDFGPRRGNSFTRHAKNSLLELGHLTSWILVNDRAVELHKIKPKGPMAVSCYICTPSGPAASSSSPSRPTEFAVGFRDDRLAAQNAPDLLVECVVDGVVVKHEEVVIRALKDDKDAKIGSVRRSRTWTWRGRRESTTKIRPFVFSPLKLTEDEDLACSSESIIRQLGTIQLRVFRGKVGTAAKAVGDEGYRAGIEAVEEMVFEESSAKVKGGGVSHQAGLGPARFEKPTARSTFEMNPLDSEEKPYVTLEFVYRSREVLELEGIIPPQRPPTPPPAASSSSSRSNSNRDPSMSAVPKDRTESPALILAGRPSTVRRSTTPPHQRSRYDPRAKKEEDVEDEDAETRRRILLRKQERKELAEKNLGTIVLSDTDNESDGSSDDVSEERQKKKRKETQSGSANESDTKTKVISINTTESRNVKAAPRSSGGGASGGVGYDADDEVAQLRAEIAALKRQNELAELRRERDELARIAGLSSTTTPRQPDAAVQERGEVTSGRSSALEGNARHRKRGELDDEEREVAGLLVGARKAGAKDSRQGQMKKKLRTGESSSTEKGKGKDRERDREEVVLSDSSSD